MAIEDLMCEASGPLFEAEEGRGESPAPEAFKMLSGWKEASRVAHELHPVATVTDFDELWPWLLTGMCYAITRSVSMELRALTQTSNN